MNETALTTYPTIFWRLCRVRDLETCPPDQRYSSLVSIIGPYPSLAIGIFGLLMILHAIVVEISARRRLQNGIRNEISENTTRVR